MYICKERTYYIYKIKSTVNFQKFSLPVRIDQYYYLLENIKVSKESIIQDAKFVRTDKKNDIQTLYILSLHIFVLFDRVAADKRSDTIHLSNCIKYRQKYSIKRLQQLRHSIYVIYMSSIRVYIHYVYIQTKRDVYSVSIKMRIGEQS